MASSSKHCLDIFNWIKLIIDSSSTISHTLCIDRLIENYRVLLDHHYSNLDSDFRRSLLRELHAYHLTKIYLISKEN